MVELIILIGGTIIVISAALSALFGALNLLLHILLVDWQAVVLLHELHNFHDLFVGAERTLGTHEASGAGRREEHVTPADQVVRALGVKNGAGIDLGSDLEGDAGR